MEETVRSLDEGGESWTQPASERIDRRKTCPMVREDVRRSRVPASDRLRKTALWFTLA
jgi:hypothetical protein